MVSVSLGARAFAHGTFGNGNFGSIVFATYGETDAPATYGLASLATYPADRGATYDVPQESGN